MFKIKLNGGRTMEVPEKTFWHTTSHIMAQAIKRLYPEIKLAIGPSIDNGFYYDFDTEKPFTPEMLEAIENGAAYSKFVEMVQNQGGDISFIEDTTKSGKTKP